MAQNFKTQKRQKAYSRSELDIFSEGYYLEREKRDYPQGAREALIDFLVNSGEIRSDYYEYMRIPSGTFRSVISELLRDKTIKKNFDDKFHTYILTAYGMKRYNGYINTKNELPARKRKTDLAILNAFFDDCGVSISINNNPSINKLHVRPDQFILRFYNSYYLKRIVSNYSDAIKRSKAFGLLTGKNKNYVVYFERLARDFYFEEDLFRNEISRCLGNKVTDMLIVVEDNYEASYWLYFLMNFSEYFSGDNPFDFFTNVKILKKSEHDNGIAKKNFSLLYNENKIYDKLDEELDLYDDPGWNPVEKSVATDDVIKYFLFSLDVSRIIRIIKGYEYSKTDKEIQIHCDLETGYVLYPFAKNSGIQLMTYKTEYWNDILYRVGMTE